MSLGAEGGRVLAIEEHCVPALLRAPMKCNDLRKRSTFCKGSLPPEHMHSLCSDKDRQDRALVFGTLTW